MLEFFWIKLLAFKPATLLKRNSKITRSFSVNISEFLKIPILKKFCERLLQNNVKPNWCSCKCFSKFAGENLCQNVLFNKPIFIQKEVPELVFSWQLPEVFNNNFFKSIAIRKKYFFKKIVHQIYCKSNYANVAKISVFPHSSWWQQVIYSLISRKKTLKVVNNTPTIGLWWSLSCQISDADISLLILMTD